MSTDKQYTLTINNEVVYLGDEFPTVAWQDGIRTGTKSIVLEWNGSYADFMGGALTMRDDKPLCLECGPVAIDSWHWHTFRGVCPMVAHNKRDTDSCYSCYHGHHYDCEMGSCKCDHLGNERLEAALSAMAPGWGGEA